jgi:microcompartment protein CcmK/EutM
MQLGIVIGHATSTIKHRSLNGWRLAVVQPVGASRQPEADPVIAADKYGSAVGQTVILNLDGKAAREMIGDDKTPVRYFVIGIVDEPS